MGLGEASHYMRKRLSENKYRKEQRSWALAQAQLLCCGCSWLSLSETEGLSFQVSMGGATSWGCWEVQGHPVGMYNAGGSVARSS